jgi:hypothetical protein
MTYKNDAGATGYTAFGRAYDPKRAGFVVVQHDEHVPEHDRWEYRE